MLALLSREGPGAPISKLVERVPEVGRRELEELRARAAYVLRRRHQECFYELSWTRPGAVWAADFSAPPCRIDEEFERLVLVRDLPSAAQILAQGSHFENGDEVVLAFENLFA